MKDVSDFIIIYLIFAVTTIEGSKQQIDRDCDTTTD